MSKFRDGKYVEHFKTFLILLLSLTALIMLYDVCNLSFLNGNVGSYSENNIETLDLGYISQVSPFTIVLTSETGNHYALTAESEDLDTVYESFSANLGEALGTAGTPIEVSREDWETALSSKGVYFDYLSEQAIYELSAYLGSGASGDLSERWARQICLSEAEDGSIDLYFVVSNTSSAYKCTTPLSYASIEQKVLEYVPEGAVFNFELEESFENVASEMIISYSDVSLTALEAKNPLSNTVTYEDLLSAFSISSYIAEEYNESDGTLVYVENDVSLRVTLQGDVTYVNTRDTGGQYISPMTAIEMAYAVLNESLINRNEEVELYISSISYNSIDNRYTIRFDYKVNGVTMSFSDGASAAEFKIIDGEITTASIRLRDYELMEATVKTFSSFQAAALVENAGGGEAVLCYIDNMETVSAGWMIK